MDSCTLERFQAARTVLILGVLMLCMLNLLVSAAPSNLSANSAPHLHSPADRMDFRRWFTFLAESRFYARKPLRCVSDADGLLRWASARPSENTMQGGTDPWSFHCCLSCRL